MSDQVTSLYVHIPFCLAICTYCDFSKMYYNEQLVNNYLENLEVELSNYTIDNLMKTIYIGGGTPTSLTITQLKKLLTMLKPYAKEVIEYSIECNPETMTIEKLVLLKEFGVNRLSIGVQTFNETILKKIGRGHNNQQVFDVIKNAKDIGFKNISIDMMYGLPNMSIQDIENDLKMIHQLKELVHVSYYSLILEEHTILYNQRYQMIDDEKEAYIYQLIEKQLSSYGFHKYEVSNFCKDGYQSLHNLGYWLNQRYYGVGLGSHGYIGDTRYSNTKSISLYNKQQFQANQIQLTKEDQIFEEIMLGLRTVQGMNLTAFQKKYDVSLLELYQDIIFKWIEKDMLVIKDNFLTTTANGMLLLHEILEDFME